MALISSTDYPAYLIVNRVNKIENELILLILNFAFCSSERFDQI